MQLAVLAQHVSTVLTEYPEYRITLKGAYYDDNYPLYAIDLPLQSPMKEYNLSRMLSKVFAVALLRDIFQDRV